MSKPEVDPVFQRLLQQSLTEALPERIEDDLANTLKYKLSKCLGRNSWYFTAGMERQRMVVTASDKQQTQLHPNPTHHPIAF